MQKAALKYLWFQFVFYGSSHMARPNDGDRVQSGWWEVGKARQLKSHLIYGLKVQVEVV